MNTLPIHKAQRGPHENQEGPQKQSFGSCAILHQNTTCKMHDHVQRSGTASCLARGILDFRKLDSKGEYENSRQCTWRFLRTQRVALIAVAECTPASGSAPLAKLKTTRASAPCTDDSEAKLKPRARMVAARAQNAEQ